MFALFATLLFFFFNDTATTEIYTLSLHDALPISLPENLRVIAVDMRGHGRSEKTGPMTDWTVPAKDIGELVADRKSTRLNSSHVEISYAVFCLKKKKNKQAVITSHKNSLIDLHPH